MSAHLHVLILAADDALVQDRPLQLLPVAGKPALSHVVNHAIAVAGTSVSVVLGAHAGDITALLQRSATQAIINRHWPEGVASSIRAGMQTLSGGCDAVLILLAEHVAVTAADLRRLLAAWNGQDSILAASVYNGRMDLPAIFPRSVFSELLRLRGNQSANVVIQRNSSRVTPVAMPHAAYQLASADDFGEMQVLLKQDERAVIL
jgi:molybdenum cofactor cytidylyltransferase